MKKGLLWYSATTLLILQMLIVVTGGLVRVTGSGLGCPTWPKCTSQSLVPIETQSQFHTWIEFGNRLLTFALLAAAVATLITTSKRYADREDLHRLAWFQFFGIFGQGILGGITVLTKLNPIPVACHLLLSMVLIAGAATLQFKVNEYKENSEKEDAKIGKILTGFAFLTLIAGTVVTGSGPHAGDWQAPRFHLNIADVAKIHGLLVSITLGITLFIAFKSSPAQRGAANILLTVILGQALIGLLQWWQGLPQALVGLHLLGASLFWLATWRTRLSFKYQKVS